MFVQLTKYLICGVMLTHSLLGCHAHHVADLCCTAAMGQMQQLWPAGSETGNSIRPAVACHCGHAHAEPASSKPAQNTAKADTEPNAGSDTAPLPLTDCCAEHKCVYLPDSAAPELIDLTIPVSELLDSLLVTQACQPCSQIAANFRIAEQDPPARLRARTQVWRYPVHASIVQRNRATACAHASLATLVPCPLPLSLSNRGPAHSAFCRCRFLIASTR